MALEKVNLEEEGEHELLEASLRRGQCAKERMGEEAAHLRSAEQHFLLNLLTQQLTGRETQHMYSALHHRTVVTCIDILP